MTRQKIAFFDIDGTLTSEIDGSVPESAKEAIRKAREKGHLMFLNTGRCFQNVEPRFRTVGFDGYVCGCGTHILLGEETKLHVHPTPEIISAIRKAAQSCDVDILFESSEFVCFDRSRPLHHPNAIRQYEHFVARNYQMDQNLLAPDFYSDKFVIWFMEDTQLEAFRQTSDLYFDCIDRGNNFREFVPYGYSKATGIQYLLDYYHLDLSDAYAFGDSANDLTMLSYVPNSVAMGNADPASLKDMVSYVTTNASENGIANALENLGFFD